MANERLRFVSDSLEKNCGPRTKFDIINPLRMKVFEARECITEVQDDLDECIARESCSDLMYDIHCARKLLKHIYWTLRDECDSLLREKDDELVAMNTAEWEESEERMKVEWKDKG